MGSSLVRVTKVLFRVTVYGFALLGFVLTAGFFGVRMGWTNVSGEADVHTEAYSKMAERLATIPTKQASPSAKQISKDQEVLQEYLCVVAAVGKRVPENARAILETYEETESLLLMANMILAVSIRLEGDKAFTEEKAKCETNREASTEELDPLVLASQYKDASSKETAFSWMVKPEWQTIEEAILKDREDIDEAATLTGVPSRLIVATCIVEQLRLYFTQRELYQKVFKPLTLLSTANKMAWGVMAIKEDTAIKTESHLKDASSPFYLGKEMEDAITFTTADHNQERYQRLTDQHDHFYSYLYGGLYLAQVAKQWERAGYPIAERPEIMSTLYNIGYGNSKPKEKPEVGGSTIDIEGAKYTFGSLAYEFYYSGRLTEYFPYER